MLQSTTSLTASALYALVDTNLDVIIRVLDNNLTACVNARSFLEPSNLPHPHQKVIAVTSGCQVFGPIITLFLQYVLDSTLGTKADV